MPEKLADLFHALAALSRLVALVPLLALALPAVAQSTVELGNASVELTGPWRFHAGDDPAWAAAEFDDSGWGTQDLAPPLGSFDPYLGSSGFVPGWTARGYRGYSGFAWYRLRVNLRNPGQGSLALKMPQNVDDAYQVFANGQLIGGFGQFSPRRVVNYVSQPRAFLLPAHLTGGPITLAVRMWMDPHTALVESAAGGMHGPPVIGQAPVVLSMLRLDWDTVGQSRTSALWVAAILFLAIVVAFSLYAMDRNEKAYLWLGINCAVNLLIIFVDQMVYRTTWVSAMSALFVRDVVFYPLVMAVWTFFWACWFRVERQARLRHIVWPLVGLLALASALQHAPLYGRVFPAEASAWLLPSALLLKLLLGAPVLWIAARALRRNRTEGLLALPAVVLTGIAQYQYAFAALRAPIVFFVGGYAISISQIATIVSLAIVTVLLSRRFLHAQRAREHWRVEMEQARQVQHLLIPERIGSVPGFALQSEYRPAHQVGGDFFLILPGKDGSILVLIGDVSGKGLHAAMLVAMILGSVRTLAVSTREPETILRVLNQRLCEGLRGQFATCLALHVSAEGQTRIANAGHLPPFLNGSELALQGSLPLGLVEDAPLEQCLVELNAGDRLVLITDGIVEARNRRNELFGFSRLSELMRRDCSPVEITEAALDFGQDDDITVLRIERLGKGAALEEAREPARIMEYS